MTQESYRRTVAKTAALFMAALLLGCDAEKQESHRRERRVGHLEAEQVRLQEAQRLATEHLAIERRRSAQLIAEIDARRNIEVLLISVTVLGGCALAVAIYALMRNQRTTP